MKTLKKILKNQAKLKTQGYVPLGWCRGYLVWGKESVSKRSITKIFSPETDLKFVDSFNAIISE